MPPPTLKPRLPVVRTVIWGVLALLGLACFAPSLPNWFLPPTKNGNDAFGDFVQEWLSAKNFYAGVSVYDNQLRAFERHVPNVRVNPNECLPYNAHPPASVLVALPFGLTDYKTAHLAWNVVTFLVFLASLAVVLRELDGGLYWWHAAPVLALVLWFVPVWENLQYGQISFLIGGLFAFGWAADRRGYGFVGGLAAGLATALKLFPGLLLVYFLFARKWKAAAGLVVGAAALNALTALVLGPSAFETYFREVLPSVKFFQYSMLNASAHGFWNRFAFAPDVAGTFGERPMIATVGLGATLLLIAGAVGWSGWRSGRDGDPDRGWAVTIAAMTLASPIAWGHYYVMLAIPFGVLAARWRAVPLRIATGWLLTMMALKDTYYLILISKRNRELVHRDTGHGVTPLYAVAELFAGVSLLTYANLALLALLVFMPRLTPGRRPEDAGPSPASADTPAPSPPRDP